MTPCLCTPRVDARAGMGDDGRVPRLPRFLTPGSQTLFWRVFLLNGVVFLMGVGALALTPATVSSPLLSNELVVLCVGLALMLGLNAVLLRVGLAPLDRLMSMMDTIDLLRPGQRLPQAHEGGLAPLVRTFNAMLSRLEAERAASSGQALSAQEGERRRIARELHDEIGQGLTAVLLGLKGVADRAPDDLRADLLEVQEAARSSLDDVRRIAQRLRPDALDELGLRAALNVLVTEFSELTDLTVRRQWDSTLSGLPDEVDVVLYRVAQESLTNVARHAQARQVWVSVAHESGNLLLHVIDDGQGVRHPEGAGIRGMRERALLVGGDLRIESPPGAGTTVTLCIPGIPGGPRIPAVTREG